MKKKLKLDLSNSIRRLDLMASRLVNSSFIGTYKSSFRGRGLEFNGYRTYTPDDDAARIDWRASVRSKELLVRNYVEERNVNVYFLIDVSSSMVYGSTDKLKVEYAAEIVAALSYTILNAGDNIGYALFSDKIIKKTPFVTGYRQYHSIIKTLVDPNNYSGGYDLEEALKFSLSFIKQYAIVIIISDFIGLSTGWEKYLKMLKMNFEVIGIMIRDPCDRKLPLFDGKVLLKNPYNEEKIAINPAKISKDYEKQVLNQERKIEEIFTGAKTDFISLSTSESFVKPITQFFLRRGKRQSK